MSIVLEKCKQEMHVLPRYFITGDKHRDFRTIIRFCRREKTTCADTVIILGDAGLNVDGDWRDNRLKKRLARLPITIFCIHGNKENRPEHIPSYKREMYAGGPVYVEPRYPNLLFAVDGGIYRFGGKTAVVIGGAHSVDRHRKDARWWPDEEPDAETRARIEHTLLERGNHLDYIFSHAAPLKFEPVEMLASRSAADQSSKKRVFPLDIDKSLARWLDTLEERLDYRIWYCGHYHTDKTAGRARLMFGDIQTLGGDQL